MLVFEISNTDFSAEFHYLLLLAAIGIVSSRGELNLSVLSPFPVCILFFVSFKGIGK